MGDHMKPTTAFDRFQTVVNADPEHVREARRRRDVFCQAFRTLPDCTEQLPSGSLARGTQRDPIHDVDLIMVFDPAMHPTWDAGPGSADEALRYVRDRVTELLGATNGRHARKVRYTLLRNHVVKCFLDDPDDPDAFAVEVMPALRVEGGLRVPERKHDRWATVNPEFLIAAVAQRHAEWNRFAPMVRVMKAWKDHVGLDMKSLVAEVLVLERMPRPPANGDLTRQVALQRFFTAAAAAVMAGVHDPAGLCGEIQPDLDRVAVRAQLLEAADLAARAVAAEGRGEDARAVRLWHAVFGPDFPLPPANDGTGPGVITGAPALLGSARPRVKEAPQG
ncbi:hypothetical protein ACI8AF_24985 [Blastococcus sp. SYSU D00669]